MLDKAQAHALANDWIDAWNRHDLEAILSHYTDDVELVSPVAAERLSLPGGKVSGKAALQTYFERGLVSNPALHFELRDVMWGVTSVLLYYVNQRGTMTGELMELTPDGKVRRVVANYSG
jgi:hypothetical protein